MRMVNLAAVAAFAILAAGPALAGDPRDGGHGGGGYSGGCGGGCGGGGGHPPAPPGGGYSGNINVNVNANANANANASASAFAGASAGSYFNARAYDVGGIRSRGYGGGTVYVGGGYGGDGGGHYGGGAVYNEEVYGGRACASAPFGYVVGGFGREGRRPPACVGDGGGTCRGDDRGGRYGYSERRHCDGGRREEHADSYRRSGGSHESYESYEDYGSWSGGYVEEREHGSVDYERGSSDRGHGCGGCRPDDRAYHAREPEPRYEEPHRPQVHAPPVYEAPVYQAPAYEPPVYEVPMTPNQYYGIGDPSPPPRQYYRQEPGERG